MARTRKRDLTEALAHGTARHGLPGSPWRIRAGKVEIGRPMLDVNGLPTGKLTWNRLPASKKELAPVEGWILEKNP